MHCALFYSAGYTVDRLGGARGQMTGVRGGHDRLDTWLDTTHKVHKLNLVSKLIIWSIMSTTLSQSAHNNGLKVHITQL